MQILIKKKEKTCVYIREYKRNVAINGKESKFLEK